jgi:hypothetical protein
LFLPASLSLAVAGCIVDPWREAEPPWSAASVDGAADARVRLRDGTLVILGDPRIEPGAGGGSIVGRVGRSERTVPLDHVLQLETRRTELLPAVANGAAMAVVVAVAIVLDPLGWIPLALSSRD